MIQAFAAITLIGQAMFLLGVLAGAAFGVAGARGVLGIVLAVLIFAPAAFAAAAYLSPGIVARWPGLIPAPPGSYPAVALFISASLQGVFALASLYALIMSPFTIMEHGASLAWMLLPVPLITVFAGGAYFSGSYAKRGPWRQPC